MILILRLVPQFEPLFHVAKTKSHKSVKIYREPQKCLVKSLATPWRVNYGNGLITGTVNYPMNYTIYVIITLFEQDGNPDGLFWTMESCLTSNLMKKSNKVAKAP